MVAGSGTHSYEALCEAFKQGWYRNWLRVQKFAAVTIIARGLYISAWV